MTLNLKALALSGDRRLWAALKVITRLSYRGVCVGVSVLGWFLAAVDWEEARKVGSSTYNVIVYIMIKIIKNLIVLFLLTTVISSCAVSTVFEVDANIKEYNSHSHKISLGDSKEKFLETIYSLQVDLHDKYKKPPESYLKDGVIVEIFFMRSRRQADGLTTDDEFTPYIFNDGKLVAVGWTSIGGPITHGQTRDVNTTNVNVENNQVIY